jgi:hypothetical protein
LRVERGRPAARFEAGLTCKSAYKAWRKHHGRANAEVRLKESLKLGKEHHCKLPASALK